MVVVVVCDVGGGAGVVTVVWRVVVVVAVGSLEQETSIKAKTDSAEPSIIAFFIACIVSSNDSSQVASPDVFRAKNSSFSGERTSQIVCFRCALLVPNRIVKTQDAAHSVEEKSKLTETMIKTRPALNNANPFRSSRAASLGLHVSFSIREFSS